MNFLSRIVLMVSLFIGGFGQVITAMEKPAADPFAFSLGESNRPQRVPRGRAAQPAPAAAFSFGGAAQSSVNFDFSNQSDRLVAIWIWMQGKIFPVDSPQAFSFSADFNPSWQHLILAPVQDYNRPILPFSGKPEPIYIYTSAGFYTFNFKNNLLELNKMLPAGQGKIETESIKSMPYNGVTPILVIINPDGSVDFVKRNP